MYSISETSLRDGRQKDWFIMREMPNEYKWFKLHRTQNNSLFQRVNRVEILAEVAMLFGHSAEVWPSPWNTANAFRCHSNYDLPLNYIIRWRWPPTEDISTRLPTLPTRKHCSKERTKHADICKHVPEWSKLLTRITAFATLYQIVLLYKKTNLMENSSNLMSITSSANY